MIFKTKYLKLNITFPELWLNQKPVLGADLAREKLYIKELGLDFTYE
jgi:hypothetical protein